MKKGEFQVRNRRNKGWFYIDNDYLNGYAKIFGAIGTAIYISLCRHADQHQKCFPSQKLISEELNISERTIRKYIDLFEKYNLISKEKIRNKEGKWLNNLYWLLDKTEWKKPEATVSYGSQRQMTTEPEANDDINQRQQFPIKNTNNIKNTNKKNTNIAGQSPAVNETIKNVINGIITAFSGVNPIYTALFSNKTQRGAVERLLKIYGEEKLLKMVQALKDIIYKKYAPKITTPLELENNLGKLIAFIKQEQDRSGKYQIEVLEYPDGTKYEVNAK